MDNKVLIGISTGEYARRADFYDYINVLEKPSNALILITHDRSPAKNRNIIFQGALESGCSHVLLIDDDMTFEKNALLKLLSHDKDIVSGLYLGRAYPHQPLIFDLLNSKGEALYSYLDGELPELMPIEAAGFGFLLLKTSILEKIEKPWVRLGELDAENWCDDIGFFNRAKKAGIKSYCDTTVCCGHIGTMIIKPQFKDGQWLTVYDTNGRGGIATPQVPPGLPYEMEDKAH